MAPPQLRSLARDALDTAETIWLALLMPNRPVAIKTSSPRRYFRLYRKMRFFRYISSNKIYHTPKFSHLVIALIPTDSFAVEFGGVVVVGHEILWLYPLRTPYFPISNNLRWTSSQLPTRSNGPTPASEPCQRCPRHCWDHMVGLAHALVCFWSPP